MKVCSKCGMELPSECFPIDKKGKGGLASQCRDCRNEYYKRHYKKAKRNVDKYKTQCAKCHCAEPYVLTFHHIDPKTKLFNVSCAHRNTPSVMKEIEKCICLCQNCHHTFHYFYGMTPHRPTEALEEFLNPKWKPHITYKSANAN